MMYDHEKSDSAIVAVKPTNKAWQPAAELAEPRAEAEGNVSQQSTGRAQHRGTVSQALERIRQVARQRKKEKFTALFHHVSTDHLEEAFSELKENAAAGVDGLTCRDYEQHLERNLEDLHARVDRGAYRALPTRRVYIPKPDGRQRPIAVAALEDKIVQRATAAVLSAIYEEDFLGFSYGFRPGRGTHDAQDALVVGIESKKVNWILDADIRSFFDRVSYCTQVHEAWLKRSVCEQFSLRRKPFLRPRLTWMALMSPRLTRCHTVCRETPSRRMAWNMVRYPSGASSAMRARKSSVRRICHGALAQWRLAVERAIYEAQRAERRYRAIDPDNRLVARGLEAEWEKSLRELETAKAELARREQRRPRILSADKRSRLLALGTDLREVWRAPPTTARDKKELLRALLEEVIIAVKKDEYRSHLTLRWRGGALAEIDLDLPRRRAAPVRTDEDTVALVRRLAVHYPDAVIAGILNRQQRTTAYGH